MNIEEEYDCSPYNENCVSVSRNYNYKPAMFAEALVFRRQLLRVMKYCPGVQFKIIWNAHDLGEYTSVLIQTDDWDAFEYLENNLPADWDDISLDEIVHSQILKDYWTATDTEYWNELTGRRIHE